MIIVQTEHLILRDMIEEDLILREKWETEETEWQRWDAPWEYEGLTEAETAAQLQDYLDGLAARLEVLRHKPETEIRYSFQIVEKATGAYIGWVNAYHIDEDYNYCDTDALLAVGLDIPAVSARGRGYGQEALQAVAEYFFRHGYEKIYTQTWSGNTRMVHVAEKLGFRLVCRKRGIRRVRGGTYDGLTFEMCRAD